MTNKAITAIERCHMLRPGDTVLAAVSGGADSMALLHVLLEIKEKYSLNLIAAHFNHGIRGAEAERDERFVSHACAELGVECKVGRANVPALAKERRLGVEECGRLLRYEFFEQVAPQGKIATAHTLSDCEETFLFNLARGASLHGLASIPPVRGNVIRPLIDCSRAEIEEYCRINGIEYVTDSTNLSDAYTRNRLRHNAVPLLREINPAFDSAFARCVSGLRDDDDLLSQLALGVLERAKTPQGYLVQQLTDVHPALGKRAVAAAIEEFTGVKPETLHIERVCALLKSGGDVQVGGGVSLRVHGGLLKKVAEPAGEWQVKASAGLNNLPYGSVFVEIYDENNKINIQKFNKHLLANALDYDKIDGQLFFSAIRPGDKIRLHGRGVTKQLRRLLAEMRIEPEDRARVALLRDISGVVWVEGAGVCERCAVSQATTRFVLIEINE